ncbi:MAG: class I tRNA ligase family protein, partial [Clostridia bacterium]|nr:class I tRNA ligase family protein [Clostridia bacterium]
LLHPFMPFITEELYQNLPGHDETIMRSDWPKPVAQYDFPADESSAESLMELIRAIRNVRVEMNVPAARRTELYIVTDPDGARRAEEARDYFIKLAYASSVTVVADRAAVPSDSVSAVSRFAEAFMPLSQLIDIGKELERVSREAERTNAEVARAQGKLSNAKFIEKAPEDVVEAERKKLAAALEVLDKLNSRLDELRRMAK